MTTKGFFASPPPSTPPRGRRSESSESKAPRLEIKDNNDIEVIGETLLFHIARHPNPKSKHYKTLRILLSDGIAQPSPEQSKEVINLRYEQSIQQSRITLLDVIKSYLKKSNNDLALTLLFIRNLKIALFPSTSKQSPKSKDQKTSEAVDRIRSSFGLHDSFDPNLTHATLGQIKDKYFLTWQDTLVRDFAALDEAAASQSLVNLNSTRKQLDRGIDDTLGTITTKLADKVEEIQESAIPRERQAPDLVTLQTPLKTVPVPSDTPNSPSGLESFSVLSGPEARKIAEHKHQINVLDFEGNAPIHYIVKRGDTRALRILLQHRANLDIQDREGNTALHLAIQIGNVDMVCALIKDGASINIPNKRKKSALDVTDSQQNSLLHLLSKSGDAIAINYFMNQFDSKTETEPKTPVRSRRSSGKPPTPVKFSITDVASETSPELNEEKSNEFLPPLEESPVQKKHLKTPTSKQKLKRIDLTVDKLIEQVNKTNQENLTPYQTGLAILTRQQKITRGLKRRIANFSSPQKNATDIATELNNSWLNSSRKRTLEKAAAASAIKTKGATNYLVSTINEQTQPEPKLSKTGIQTPDFSKLATSLKTGKDYLTKLHPIVCLLNAIKLNCEIERAKHQPDSSDWIILNKKVLALDAKLTELIELLQQQINEEPNQEAIAKKIDELINNADIQEIRVVKFRPEFLRPKKSKTVVLLEEVKKINGGEIMDNLPDFNTL